MTADEFNAKVRTEAAKELSEKVQAAVPEFREAYSEGIGTELLAAMHILQTDCNAGATQRLAMIAEIGNDMSVEEYIQQIKGAAGMLGRQVRFLCGEAARLPHEHDEQLYWLQNWGQTFVEQSEPEIESYALKITVRGGWVWLTEAERNLILQGGQVSRLSEVTA